MEFITALDLNILWGIQHVLKNELMDGLMVFLSFLGNAGGIWIVLTLLMLWRPRTRRVGAAMALAMALCFVVGNLGIKPLVGRVRPFVVDPTISVMMMPGDPYSFPSGHAMNAFAATTALGCSHRRWGAYALLLATLISFSRLYLMVHYPTDVFAGALIGVLGGLIAYAVVEHFYPVSQPERPLQR